MNGVHNIRGSISCLKIIFSSITSYYYKYPSGVLKVSCRGRFPLVLYIGGPMDHARKAAEEQISSYKLS
jgi:hypothetical protein